jgi:hypothetical protein
MMFRLDWGTGRVEFTLVDDVELGQSKIHKTHTFVVSADGSENCQLECQQIACHDGPSTRSPKGRKERTSVARIGEVFQQRRDASAV